MKLHQEPKESQDRECGAPESEAVFGMTPRFQITLNAEQCISVLFRDPFSDHDFLLDRQVFKGLGGET